MLRTLDTCAVVLLAVGLWVLLRNKESPTEKLATWTEGKGGSRLVQEPGVLRQCFSAEVPITAIVEYTFSDGFVPPEIDCLSLLQDLEQVSDGGKYGEGEGGRGKGKGGAKMKWEKNGEEWNLTTEIINSSRLPRSDVSSGQ